MTHDTGPRRMGDATLPPWQGETYHGRSPVKPPTWDWKVATYVFLGGLGGAAQMLGLAGRKRPGLARRARWLALASALAGPPLIIADLKTPRRWYNMLRILRPTSAMSVGSWILTAFGGFSGLAVLGDLIGGRRGARLAEAAQVPAMIAGAGMATYTGALFSATSNPRWSVHPGRMSQAFGAAGIASAAAGLALVESAPRTRRALEAVALVAAVAELGLSQRLAQERRTAGIDLAADDRVTHDLETAATVMQVAAPVLYGFDLLAGRSGRGVAGAAGVAVLGGSLLMRLAEVRGARASAARAEDSFRLRQPPEGRSPS